MSGPCQPTNKNAGFPFRAPNFSAPLALDTELRVFPQDATVKGVIIGNVADQLRRAGHRAERYTVFRDYSMHAYIHLCIEAAEILFPNEPAREGLRRIGHGHYAAFVDTTLGRMIFGLLGRNMVAVLKSSPKGYKHTTNTSDCATVDVDEENKCATICLKGVPFLDSLQVGVYEAGMRATGHEGVVRVAPAPNDPDALLLQCDWT